MSTKNSRMLQRGFTLIEVMVIVIVIGILISIATVSYFEIVRRASVAEIQADLKEVAITLDKYMSDNGEYPLSGSATITGLPKADGVTYDYSTTGDAYYLTASLDTDSSIVYCVTETDTSPTEGACEVPASSFAVAWGGTGSEMLYSYAQTSDGGYVLVGSTDSFGASGEDAFTAKYNSAGEVVWNKTWGSTGTDRASRVIQSSDGGYAIAGYTNSYGAGLGDTFLAKYSSDGVLSWNKTWGGTLEDSISGAFQSSDGGYVIVGTTYSFGAGQRDVYILKYASDGTLSWSKTWGGTSDELIESVFKSADDGIVVAGRTYSYGAGSTDAFITKYTSAGELAWSRTTGGSNTDYGYDAIQTSDGGYVIVGSVYGLGAGASDAFISKYTSDGTLSWSKRWGGTLNDAASRVVQTSDGGYAVAGSTYSFGAGSSEAFLIKYTSNGTLSWDQTWGGTGNDYADYLFQASDGGYVIGARTYSFGAGLQDTYIAKYTSGGVFEWNKTFGGTNNDYNYGIAKASDGGFMMFGRTYSYGAGGYDALVAKFTSSGEMTGCSSPMCQGPTATTSSPSATAADLSATTTSPTTATASQSTSTTSPTATEAVPTAETTIVAAP